MNSRALVFWRSWPRNPFQARSKRVRLEVGSPRSGLRLAALGLADGFEAVFRNVALAASEKSSRWVDVTWVAGWVLKWRREVFRRIVSVPCALTGAPVKLFSKWFSQRICRLPRRTGQKCGVWRRRGSPSQSLSESGENGASCGGTRACVAGLTGGGKNENFRFAVNRKKGTCLEQKSLAPPVGLEPTTYGLTVRRSTD